jgi:hypothetical protein
MLTKVVQVRSLNGYKLQVRFNDGTGGVHDFATLVDEPGPMIEPLRDKVYFKRVFIEHGALTWPNGFDIAPEWLHREMAAAKELHHDAAE